MIGTHERLILHTAVELANNPDKLQRAITHQDIHRGLPPLLRNEIVSDTVFATRDQEIKLARILIQLFA